MTIHLYAEHLANIRTLSVQISLPDASDDRTSATVSADGGSLTVSHRGQTNTIILPVNVLGRIQSGQLKFPVLPSSHANFRVQLRESSDRRDGNAREGANTVPWTASSLDINSEITCAGCRTVIVERGRVRLWKDLPSENWAEMMDFWHCHRPHVPPDRDHKTPRKGYNADSTLAMEPGVGMADPASFLCMAEDCQNLEIVKSTTPQTSERKIQCKTCHQQIGQVDPPTNGYKLRKLRLALSTSPSTPAKSYSADKWLACLLLSSTESQGVRKFHISRVREKGEAMKLWIFTPDLWVSSSASNIQPLRTVKILWKEAITTANDSGTLNRQALSEAEIEIPDDEFLALRESLSEGARLVPDKARKFQDWDVALLPRFTGHDLGK